MIIRKLISLLWPLLVITIQSYCQPAGIRRGEIECDQSLFGELYAPDIQPDITTYFNKDWLPGDLLLTDGRLILNKKIRYNCLLDELLWFEPVTKQAIMFDKEGVARFHFPDLNGDSAVYFSRLKVERSPGGEQVSIFAEELCTGNISLFVFHSFYFDRSEIVQKDKRYVLKDIYKESPVFYIRFPDDKIVSLKKLSRSKIISLFPSYGDQIKEYAKEKGWSRTGNRHELLELFHYINSLYGSSR